MAGIARVGEVEIAYEELGDPNGQPLLLVMGLGMQMIAWDERFCGLLGERGYRVIRFDNRDVGLSSWTIGPLPRRHAVLAGIRRRLAYTLGDMADDAAGLLDRLGIESAHVVGASMGGMIAQVLGYRHPARVRSLGLIMTGPGKRHLALPRIRVLGAFFAAAPPEREAYADHALGLFRLIGSPAYLMPEPEIRELLLASYDRAHNPAGVIRQLHAINASGDRSRALRLVRAPTVVIHGTADPLVRPISARALAREIPDAELLMIEGMGHDLPPQLWPQITEALAANAARAPAAARVPAAPTAPAS
jgi:pimeloyl-ACP methyl ester carboxylesterase